MNRRIGFPIEDGFHGAGNGVVTELEEILDYIATTKFTVDKIWVDIKLHHSLVKAILQIADAEVDVPKTQTIFEGLKNGPITCCYRHRAKTIPFFIDPWIRENVLVLEGDEP